MVCLKQRFDGPVPLSPLDVTTLIYLAKTNGGTGDKGRGAVKLQRLLLRARRHPFSIFCATPSEYAAIDRWCKALLDHCPMARFWTDQHGNRRYWIVI